MDRVIVTSYTWIIVGKSTQHLSQSHIHTKLSNFVSCVCLPPYPSAGVPDETRSGTSAGQKFLDSIRREDGELLNLVCTYMTLISNRKFAPHKKSTGSIQSYDVNWKWERIQGKKVYFQKPIISLIININKELSMKRASARKILLTEKWVWSFRLIYLRSNAFNWKNFENKNWRATFLLLVIILLINTEFRGNRRKRVGGHALLMEMGKMIKLALGQPADKICDRQEFIQKISQLESSYNQK